MADDFTEFHDELRAVACDLLAKDREPGWQELVDAGWVGIEVPDDLGGAGASFAETAILLDQIGRAAGATGYLGNGVLTVGALAATAGPDSEALLAAEMSQCRGEDQERRRPHGDEGLHRKRAPLPRARPVHDDHQREEQGGGEREQRHQAQSSEIGAQDQRHPA